MPSNFGIPRPVRRFVMTLDINVARAVAHAKAMERAVHDPGPWTMQRSGVTVPAVRLVADDRVIFRAAFPDVCWLEDDEAVLFLLSRNEHIASTERDHFDGPHIIEWALALPEAVPVA
jgi:hypothetical protein